MSWAAIAALAVGTYALKAVGPVLLGARALPPALDRVLVLLPPALLAALVATNTVVSGQSLVVDARLAGVAVAAVAVWRRAPFLVVILAGTSTAALLRAAGVP